MSLTKSARVQNRVTHPTWGVEAKPVRGKPGRWTYHVIGAGVRDSIHERSEDAYRRAAELNRNLGTAG